MVCFCLGMFSDCQLSVYFRCLLSISYGSEILKPKEGHKRQLLAAQEQAIERGQLETWLQGNKLSLNVAKTHSMLTSTKQKGSSLRSRMKPWN